MDQIKALLEEEFIEIDGLILRKGKLKTSKLELQFLKSKLIDQVSIEKEFYHIHLEDLIDENGGVLNFNEQKMVALEIKDNWMGKLVKQFPSKEFKIEIEDLSPFQVTLYCYHVPESGSKKESR